MQGARQKNAGAVCRVIFASDQQKKGRRENLRPGGAFRGAATFRFEMHYISEMPFQNAYIIFVFTNNRMVLAVYSGTGICFSRERDSAATDRHGAPTFATPACKKRTGWGVSSSGQNRGAPPEATDIVVCRSPVPPPIAILVDPFEKNGIELDHQPAHAVYFGVINFRGTPFVGGIVNAAWGVASDQLTGGSPCSPRGPFRRRHRGIDADRLHSFGARGCYLSLVLGRTVFFFLAT